MAGVPFHTAMCRSLHTHDVMLVHYRHLSTHHCKPSNHSASSVQKFSSAVQPFNVSVLDGLGTRFLSVYLPCVQQFQRKLYGTFSRERSHFFYVSNNDSNQLFASTPWTLTSEGHFYTRVSNLKHWLLHYYSVCQCV